MALNIPDVEVDATTTVNQQSHLSRTFFFSPATPPEIERLINQLKTNKACRSVDAPKKFIKYGKSVIAQFLCTLYVEGEYPDLFGITEVIPIFKKGNPELATNYRPISLNHQFDKIFENLTYNRMYNYLEKYNLIDERQFAFRSSHSTIHAISSIYEELLKSNDDKLYNCCLFLDFSKAFDTVNHKIIIKKLENNFGFRDNAKLFLSNYLSNRYQYTRVSNYRSSLRTVTCGLSQGSALGPLLFLVYVNDLLSSSNFKTTLFVDDTLLQLSDCNIKKLEKRVNNELNKINVWLRNNEISLNISKSNYMLIDNCINASTKKHCEIKLQ